jgi:hypothetical protein
MAVDRKSAPEFFDDDGFDPVRAATGGNRNRTSAKKRKAGYYLPNDLIDRFDRKFHELKLEGILIDNKSSLIEAALMFALDDIDRGKTSNVLKKFKKNKG